MDEPIAGSRGGLLKPKPVLISCLSSHVTAGCIDLLGCDRLHLCASRGRLDCLEVIISQGADLSVTDGAGRGSLPSESCIIG